MQIAYQCDPQGNFVGTTPVQEDPMEPGVLLLPAFCTAIAPPAFDAATEVANFDVKTGLWSVSPKQVPAPVATPAVPEVATPKNKPVTQAQEIAIIVDGLWKVVPDFRGVDYWVGGVQGVPITDVGVAPPADAVFVKPAPTTAEIIADYTTVIQKRLDDFAKTRNYDGILSACTYATSTIAKFAAEGKAAVDLRDSTWSAAYSILNAVQAGTQAMPTETELLAMLPALAWPV